MYGQYCSEMNFISLDFSTRLGHNRQYFYSLVIEIGAPNGYLLAEGPLSMLT
jgi:hypothetical protein